MQETPYKSIQKESTQVNMVVCTEKLIIGEPDVQLQHILVQLGNL